MLLITKQIVAPIASGSLAGLTQSRRRCRRKNCLVDLKIALGQLCQPLHVFADGAYAGAKLQASLTAIGAWTLEIVKRSDTAKGFERLPRRWVVERSFASLNRNRRLAKDFEALVETAVAWLMLASVKLLLRILVRQ